MKKSFLRDACGLAALWAVLAMPVQAQQNGPQRPSSFADRAKSWAEGFFGKPQNRRTPGDYNGSPAQNQARNGGANRNGGQTNNNNRPTNNSNNNRTGQAANRTGQRGNSYNERGSQNRGQEQRGQRSNPDQNGGMVYEPRNGAGSNRGAMPNGANTDNRDRSRGRNPQNRNDNSAPAIARIPRNERSGDEPYDPEGEYVPNSGGGISSAPQPLFVPPTEHQDSEEADDESGDNEEGTASPQESVPQRRGSSRRTAQPGYRKEPAVRAPSRLSANDYEAAEPDQDDESVASDDAAEDLRSNSGRFTRPKRGWQNTDEGRDTEDNGSSREWESRDSAVNASTSAGPTKSLSVRAPHQGRVGSSRVRNAVPETVSTQPESFTITQRTPAIRLEATGPKTLLVGKAAAYKVNVHNSGDVDGTDILVTVDVPDWAEVVSAEATTGESREPEAGKQSSQFIWYLPRIDGRGHEELALQIVARESRSMDLAVKWEAAPAKTVAQVEVQEAKLEVELSGPSEVSFGEKSIYKITFNNLGTADTENVVVKLLPLGAGQEAVDSHRVGRLEAGGSRSIEIELVARQDGELTIQVDAEADGGLKATARQQVLVRKAALNLAIEAPKFRYAGAVATYRVTVNNPGNDTARDLRLNLQLPRGATFVSCASGGQRSSDESTVMWKLDALPAGESREYQAKCVLELDGENRVQAMVTAAGDITQSLQAQTKVEALADLTLTVSDPTGAVPVGEEITYELTVRNRGSKAAETVEVSATFSQGLEPTGGSGGEYQLSEGKIVFAPLRSLPAGQERVFKVKARAEVAANHAIRVEVTCPALETTLVAEETTRFYGADDARGDAPDRSSETTRKNAQFRNKQPQSLRKLERDEATSEERLVSRETEDDGAWTSKSPKPTSTNTEPRRLAEPVRLKPLGTRR